MVGLGYVGLPLACRFARAGLTTLAFDVDQSKIERLERSENYLPHFDSQWVIDGRSTNKLQPTSDPQKLAEAANVLGSQSQALQLRYLQTLTEISSERNTNTIVFPLPLDLVEPILQKMQKP